MSKGERRAYATTKRWEPDLMTISDTISWFMDLGIGNAEIPLTALPKEWHLTEPLKPLKYWSLTWALSSDSVAHKLKLINRIEHDIYMMWYHTYRGRGALPEFLEHAVGTWAHLKPQLEAEITHESATV